MNRQNGAILLLVLAIAGIIIAKKMSDHKRELAQKGSVAAVSTKVLAGDMLAMSLKSGKPTLAEFGKGTCEQCKKMAPILAKTATLYDGKANIISVDLDDYSALGYSYRIETMPTQIYFDVQGKEVKRHIGGLSQKEIETKLASLGATK
jgi:thioredoxin 1